MSDEKYYILFVNSLANDTAGKKAVDCICKWSLFNNSEKEVYSLLKW